MSPLVKSIFAVLHNVALLSRPERKAQWDYRKAILKGFLSALTNLKGKKPQTK